MEIVPFWWIIVPGIAAFAGGSAYGVLGMTPPRYQAAKVLFWIAGLSVAVMALLFGLTVPASLAARIIGTGIIGALAAIIIVESTRWVNGLVEQAGSSKNQNEMSLFLQCVQGPPPSVWPPDGRIYVVPAAGISDPAKLIGGGGMAEYFGQPGSDMSPMWNNNKNPLINRCELINYGNAPIFNVALSIRLDFLEAIKQGDGGFQSGSLIAAKDWPIEIRKIDPGQNNGFVFYLHHIGEQFIRVSLPERASFIRAGSDQQQEAKIIKPSAMNIFLPPRKGD
jgi:hypothetical protein